MKLLPLTPVAEDTMHTLLEKILVTLQSGAVAGNYSTSTTDPTLAPPASPWTTLNTVNGRVWQYYGGAWH